MCDEVQRVRPCDSHMHCLHLYSSSIHPLARKALVIPANIHKEFPR